MKFVLPVIHHIDKDTTWEQAELAYKCGADGVFLISHMNEDNELGPLGAEINNEKWQVNGRDFKIGLNLLNTPALEAFDIVDNYELDSLWLDNAGITSGGITDLTRKLVAKMKEAQYISVFAGVAFKYQAPEPFPASAALVAKTNGFIPTTSGTKTGSAPSIEKISEMSRNTQNCLAIASGMTVDNIATFAPYLSHVLVATGVSIDEHHFDKSILTEFIKAYKNNS